MRFRYDAEHEDLRDSVRAVLGDAEGAAGRDRPTDRGWSPRTWSRLCDELELPALAVPEEDGGTGAGMVELGIVFGEAGRSLLRAPLLSTSLAIQALLRTRSGEGIAELAAGRRTGTLALREPGRAWDSEPHTRAADAGDAWRVTGTKDWVLDGTTADLFVVSASTPAGTSLFLVESADTGVGVEATETVDPTRRVAQVVFDAAAGVLLGRDGAAPVASILDTAVILLAAEQVGVAERCLEMAAEYACRRTQFGRPIGSFQAVKHKLADVLLEVEAARSSALHAAYVADRRPGDELGEAAAVAGATCSEAALLAAGASIQVHGGIGMTWEHPAHLYLRRATVSRMLLRHPQDHAERVLELAGLGQAAARDRGR